MSGLENPIPNNFKETEYTEKAGELDGVLESLESLSNQSSQIAIDVARTIESQPLSPQQKEGFRRRLVKSMKRLFRMFTFATALTGTAVVADYTITRYRVNSEIDGKGEITYTHEDSKTTHIINVLSGKEKLDESDKKDIMINYIKEALEIFPKDGKYKDIDESVLHQKTFSQLAEITKEFGSTLDDQGLPIIDPSPREFDKELYSALWKLEQECGSPKIRFRTKSREGLSKFYDAGRSFYDPLTNTAFIDMGSNETIIHHYISELAHGRQFNDNPFSSSVLGMKGILTSLSAGFGNKSEDAYNELYDQTGTLEYEAHRTIEPKLYSRLDELAPVRAARKLAEDQERERILKQVHSLDKEQKEAIRKIDDEFSKKWERLKTSAEKDRMRKKRNEQIDSLLDEYRAKRKEVYEKFYDK